MSETAENQTVGNQAAEISHPLQRSPDDSRESSPVKTWVKFEEEESKSSPQPPERGQVATIEPSQSLHQEKRSPIKEVRSGTLSNPLGAPAKLPPPPPTHPVGPHKSLPLPPPKAPPRKLPELQETNSINGKRNATALQNVSLGEGLGAAHSAPRTIRQGFSNGDVIVTLLPVNDRCAWISKAEFRPELVPEELMAEGLTLTVEDYVNALQVLVNDLRFNVYIVCYKRLLLLWIMLGFLVLLTLLFSGVRGLALFGGGIVWLVINAVGIFVCMYLKTKMNRMLERCLACVNALLLKHRILLGMDDRGKISCQKVNLVFLFFDVNYCLKYLRDMLANEERLSNLPANSSDTVPARNQPPRINPSRMDIDNSDIIITGGRQERISQKDKTADKLLLRYSQRWVKEYVRKRLDLNMPLASDPAQLEGGAPLPPRHCPTARCPCQFIEEHLRFKPSSKCNVREFFR